MFFLKMLKKIILIFQTDISENQVAWGFALGAILGLVPNMLIKCLMFVLIMTFRVNIASAFIACALYALVGFTIDPLMDKFGYFCLVDIKFLNSFYTWLYNLPIVPWTKFNNTVVMGNLVLGIILIIPNMLIAKKFLVYYRKNCRDAVSKWKIVKIITATLNATSIIKKIG